MDQPYTLVRGFSSWPPIRSNLNCCWCPMSTPRHWEIPGRISMWTPWRLRTCHTHRFHRFQLSHWPLRSTNRASWSM